MQRWVNSQIDNYFHSKRHPRTLFRGNSCHFVNLLSFASKSFFLSMRKIIWFNSQKPKNWGHVEHHKLQIVTFHSMFLECWNAAKILCNIWHYFSCQLDEGIAKICKKFNFHDGFWRADCKIHQKLLLCIWAGLAVLSCR